MDTNTEPTQNSGVEEFDANTFVDMNSDGFSEALVQYSADEAKLSKIYHATNRKPMTDDLQYRANIIGGLLNLINSTFPDPGTIEDARESLIERLCNLKVIELRSQRVLSERSEHEEILDEVNYCIAEPHAVKIADACITKLREAHGWDA